jgi:hypothetical protein
MLDNSLKSISDDELLRRLSGLLRQSRRVESELVAHIGEVDERRLYRREASSSMFAYCTEKLLLSEHEAYLRIAAARASRKHPILLAMLEDGRLHLSAIAKRFHPSQMFPRLCASFPRAHRKQNRLQPLNSVRTEDVRKNSASLR